MDHRIRSKISFHSAISTAFPLPTPKAFLRFDTSPARFAKTRYMPRSCNQACTRFRHSEQYGPRHRAPALQGNWQRNSWACANRRRLAPAASIRVATAALCLLASPVAAQEQPRQSDIGEAALDAVTQPMSDLNLRSKDIPLLLQIAEVAPYDVELLPDCAAISDEIARFDKVLGPDADSPEQNTGLLHKGLRQGGKMLGSFIPFRGVVRQISGANHHAKKWQSAVNAGFARRSFLKGYAKGMQCGTGMSEESASAREVLGLSD